jgi:hypothetical protein
MFKGDISVAETLSLYVIPTLVVGRKKGIRLLKCIVEDATSIAMCPLEVE